jgi:hypothetical protein
MNEIIKKYPKIFQPYEGNPYNVNWDCPKGWEHIVDWLCGSIQEYLDMMNNEWNKRDIPQVHCTQVKEKFARLEFYFHGGDQQIEGMVEMAQHIASKHCQECGSTEDVQLTTNGWYVCKCKNCRNVL